MIGDSRGQDAVEIGSAETLRFALEVAGLGIWELDIATRTARRTLRHDQIFGYETPLSEWTYALFLDHVHPEDRASVRELYDRALATGTDWHFQCRIRRGDGALRWIEARGRHFRDTNGGPPIRIVGTVADITDPKEAQLRERFLADLVERTRFLLDPDAVVWETVQAVGAFLNVSRYMYADVDAEAGMVTVANDFCQGEGVFSVAGVWPLAPWGAVVQDLSRGETVVNRDYAADPRTAGDYESIYKQTDIRANVTVPLFRDGRWVAVFSAQMCAVPRDWTREEIALLEAVSERMWLTLENARLHRVTQGAAARQRKFLREMLFSLTEGRLRLCDLPADLPAPLPRACRRVPLSRQTLKALRQQVEAVAEDVELSLERRQDLLTAAGEAAINAVNHAGGGEGCVCYGDGAIQVWIEDTGGGIAEDAIHQATLDKGYTTAGTLGHGFWLMLKTVDRIWLLTGPSGTTVVLEQEKSAPEPAWMQDTARDTA